MIFLPKCRALCVDLEKGHGAGKRAWRWRKRAWRGAIVKVARGNTSTKQGKCDLLKATTKCAPAGVRTRDLLVRNPTP